MNRIFHTRITWYQYLFLLILGVNAFAALWCKYIILAVIVMLLLIVLIEQIIHTTYTITSDGKLILYRGRFTRQQTIAIREITDVRKVHSMKFGRFSVTEYVLIEYGSGKFASVLPAKEEEFLKSLTPGPSPKERGEKKESTNLKKKEYE